MFDTKKHLRVGDPLEAGKSFINSIAISDDGYTVAVSTDHDVLVWTLRPEDLRDRACRIANRNLSLTEWQQYVGNIIPCQQICPPQQATDKACR